MHLLARRACIENTLCFQFTGKIQGELTVLVKTAQHQNARVELVRSFYLSTKFRDEPKTEVLLVLNRRPRFRRNESRLTKG